MFPIIIISVKIDQMNISINLDISNVSYFRPYKFTDKCHCYGVKKVSYKTNEELFNKQATIY